jgi:hypothetical protein
VPLLIVAFTLFVILAAIALTPLALVQRYRLGTARRRARGWSATVSVAGLAFSGPERAHTDADGVREWMAAGPGRPCPQPVGTCTRLAPFHAEPLAGARNHVGGNGQAGVWVLAELACVACHAGLWFVGGGVGRSGLTSGWRGRARVLPDILARRAPTSAVARREKRTRLLAINPNVALEYGFMKALDQPAALPEQHIPARSRPSHAGFRSFGSDRPSVKICR